MNDNRTKKAKDREWLRDVVRKALSIHDDCGDDMEGIFCYNNHGMSAITGKASPQFQIVVVIKLIKSFQNETHLPTSAITKLIADSLNEA